MKTPVCSTRRRRPSVWSQCHVLWRRQYKHPRAIPRWCYINKGSRYSDQNCTISINSYSSKFQWNKSYNFMDQHSLLRLRVRGRVKVSISPKSWWLTSMLYARYEKYNEFESEFAVAIAPLLWRPFVHDRFWDHSIVTNNILIAWPSKSMSIGEVMSMKVAHHMMPQKTVQNE